MTVLEKIRRCVSLVWDFQEFYDEEDIEDFCRNELRTYPQHDEIMEYFKHIETLEKENAEFKEQLYAFDEEREKLRKENAELRTKLEALEGQTPWKDIKDKGELIGKLTNAKEIIKNLIDYPKRFGQASGKYHHECELAEQFLNSEIEK